MNFSSKREETIAEISNLTMKDNKRLIFLRTDQNLDTRFRSIKHTLDPIILYFSLSSSVISFESDIKM